MTTSGAFSVTEVVTAARCPRQLVLLREGHRVTPPGGDAIGQAAHGALAALARAAALDGALLRALGAPAPDEAAVTGACYALAYQHTFQRALELAPTVDGEALGRLDAIVRNLSALMAALLLRARKGGHDPVQAVSTVLVASERDVSLEINGFRVNGRIDLICRDVETDETWLWDLKTYAGTDAAQEEQVRLYALASQRAGLRARPALLHVTGDRVEIAPVRPSDPAATEALSARLQDMSAWVSGTRPPPSTRDTALCHSCPAQGACWSRWGRTLDESATPTPARLTPPMSPAVTATATAAVGASDGEAGSVSPAGGRQGERALPTPPPAPSPRDRRDRVPATPPPLPPAARQSGRWPTAPAPPRPAAEPPVAPVAARDSGRWSVTPMAPRESGPFAVASVPTARDSGPFAGIPVVPAIGTRESGPFAGVPVVPAVGTRESGPFAVAPALLSAALGAAAAPAARESGPVTTSSSSGPATPSSDAVVVAVSVRESGRWTMARSSPDLPAPAPGLSPAPASSARVVSISAVPPAVPLWLGTMDRLRTPARLEPADLRKHAAVFGASGAGKTYFAKTFVEEAVLAGIPALVFDVQGDLAQLAAPQPHVPPDLAERRDRYAAAAEVRLFTPGSDAGLRVSLNPVRLPDATVSEDERAFCLAAVAENLLATVDLPAAWRKRARGYIIQHLEAALADGGLITLERLIDRLRDAEGLADEPLLTRKSQRETLVEQLRLLTVGTDRLLFQRGRPLDIGGLLRPMTPGKTPLNIVWLNGLGDQSAKERFVAMVLSDLFAWALRNPSATPQLLFYLDEVGPFMPPRSEPASKAILKQLFQQGRKLGLCGLFCSQNFTDVDYKVLAQANTLAIGRMNVTQDKDRARKMLDVPGFDADSAVARLASAPSGRFLLRNPDRFATPTWVQGRPLLTVHAAPWGESEIREHTPAALRDHWNAGSGEGS